MKCPGQDMQYWKDDAIFEVKCPECDNVVEFYKDDTTRKCPKCSHRFVNPKLDFGCASYCQFAEQCLGTLPENFLGTREDLLKDKIAVSLKRHLKTDFKRIRQATDLAQMGEKICKGEGGNLAVILCAAYLCGVDNEVSSQILLESGASDLLTNTIQATLQQNNLSSQSPIESKILFDAVQLCQYREASRQEDKPVTTANTEQVEAILLTSTARKILKEYGQ